MTITLVLAERKITASRILVVMPNWLGDGVMATPFLRALRALYPSVHIAALHKPLLAAVVDGSPFLDRTIGYPMVEVNNKPKVDSRQTVKMLRDENFALAILLPNSFRAAMLTRRAGIPNRLGYAREWRTPLLTHRVQPVMRTLEQKDRDRRKQFAIQEISAQLGKNIGAPRIGSAYQPMPEIDYYLELAKFLGATDCPRRMELGVTDAERAEADAVLQTAGFANSTEPSDSAAGPLVVIVPGANFGASKCWPPERFAAVADALLDPNGPYRAKVLLAGPPSEKPVAEAILVASRNKNKGRIVWTGALNDGHGISVGALKEIVRRSRFMICNDTGPRHFAAAFGIPTVALFGPTDQRWAETFSPCEISLQVPVPCGPCQLKQCPIDHRCMNLLTVDMVLASVRELWDKKRQS